MRLLASSLLAEVRVARARRAGIVDIVQDSDGGVLLVGGLEQRGRDGSAMAVFELRSVVPRDGRPLSSLSFFLPS